MQRRGCLLLGSGRCGSLLLGGSLVVLSVLVNGGLVWLVEDTGWLLLGILLLTFAVVCERLVF